MGLVRANRSKADYDLSDEVDVDFIQKHMDDMDNVQKKLNEINSV